MSGGYSIPAAAAHAVLHAVWQGALLAWIASVALARIPARRAAARHAVALACLLAMAVAPLVTYAAYRALGPAELSPLGGHPLGPPISADAPGSADAPLPALATPLLRPSDWIIVAIPLGWLLGAMVLAARQLGGWLLVRRLGAGASSSSISSVSSVSSAVSVGTAIPDAWLRRLDVLRGAFGIARPVALRPAAGASSPFTARALRPVIWLPVAAWHRLSPAQQDALLAHELAHVRRLDWIWNGVQSAIEALWFFHPAVRWLGRRVREEREHACDEAAAAVCGDPIALAEGLTALARQRAAPDLALAAHGGALRRRVARLLDAPVPPARGAPRWLAALAACGVALVAWVRLPVDVLIDLRVDASSDGALVPGSYREVTAETFAARHHYRATMDERGQLRELYEEDGQPRPIAPAVRAWLDELTRTVGWR